MKAEIQREFPLQGAFSREPLFCFFFFFFHIFFPFIEKKIYFNNSIHVFSVILGLCFYLSFSLVVGEQGLLFTAVPGFLAVVASLVMKHRL